MVASAARKRERRLKFGAIKSNDDFVDAAPTDVLKSTRKRKIASSEANGVSADASRKKARKQFPGARSPESSRPKANIKQGHLKAQDPNPKPNDDVVLSIPEDATPEPDDGESKKSSTTSKRRSKHILFIGNLPFSTTDESIAAHFKKLEPTSIRHRVDKESGKSRGFAFLEFKDREHLDKCLKGYHHSRFDDGRGGMRKLNVELTAGGGGGKSENRKAKLREKNDKLNEQRRVKPSHAIESEDTMATKKVSVTLPELESQIHPSRRTRVPNA